MSVTVPYQPSMHASSDIEAENQSLQLSALNSLFTAMQRLPEMTISSLWICLPSFLTEAGIGDADRKLLHHPRQTSVQYWTAVKDACLDVSEDLPSKP